MTLGSGNMQLAVELPAGEDLNEWFDQRYLLINASNVDALDGQHGNLFVEPKPPKKK